MAFQIEFSPEALDHLSGFQKYDQQIITDTIEIRLKHQPMQESRHRKLMRSNLIATRELRIGDFRAYYDVDENESAVLIRAIGIKVRNRVFIAGEEADLP